MHEYTHTHIQDYNYFKERKIMQKKRKKIDGKYLKIALASVAQWIGG